MNSNPVPDRAPWQRLVLRGGIATVVGCALLSLVIFVLPTHAARWYLDWKLGGLGIEVNGIETVEIDLWDREIRFGPVMLGAPGADPARLKRFNLAFSLSDLFERRGRGRDAVIEGLVFDVARAEDGRLTLNGLDLFEMLRPEAEQALAEPEESESGWGVGVDRFVLRDSRLRFRQPDGREVELVLADLTLDGFLSWTPDTAGRFALSGSLNGMGIEIEGQAKPFSDRIDFRASSKISAVDLAKVERFTGPLPLTRGEGTMRAALTHSGHLEPDGTIRLTNAGEISADGLSVVIPDGPEIAFGNARVELDTSETLLPDGSAAVTGSLAIDGSQARLELPDGATMDLTQATLQLDKLDLKSDPQFVLTGSLSLVLAAGQGDARIDGRSLKFDEIRLDGSLAEVSVAPGGRLGAKVKADLTVASPAVAGPLQGRAARLSLGLTGGDVHNSEAGFAANGGLSLELKQLSARSASDGEGWSAAIDGLSLAADRFSLDAPAGGPLKWDTAFGLDVSKISAEVDGDHSGAVTIDGLRIEGGAMDSDLRARAGLLEARGAALVSATGAVPGTLAIAGLRLESAAADGDLKGVFGRLQLDDVSFDGTPGSQQDGGSVSARIGRVSVDAASRDAYGAMKAQRLALENATGSVSGPRPIKGEFAALVLESLAATPEIEGSAGKAALSDFAFSIDGGDAMSLKMDALTIDGITASDAPAFRAGTATLAGFDLAATSALLPPDLETAPDGATNSSASAKPPELTIGRFTLADPAHISLIDKRQSPPVSLDAIVKKLEVANLDSRAPDKHPALSFAATLNEFTDLSAEGWFNPFGDRPNFDLKTAVSNLELPAFSTYAARHLGVNLETGRLSVQADGRMVEGALDVATDLNLANLKFSPLSPEDAERLSATAGVPVETAVGLLEDRDGRIKLSIPVKGDIDNPDFQIDHVINKAIGNAIAGAIGTTLKVIFPPALLISAISSASEGSGIAFAPAPFGPGTATMQPKAFELAEALATLLKQRPKLTVSVCGRAVAADLQALLTPDATAIVADRRAAYQRDLAAWREKLAPLIDRGLVDAAGKPLTDKLPGPLPKRPAEPVLDEQAIVKELAAERADALRDSLTALATDRTRTLRRVLSEKHAVENRQVAECRPVYDPADTGEPRAIIDL